VREIAKRVWLEPAVAIGLVTSLALLILALATDTQWDASVIAGIAAPFATGLGIRPFVRPTAGDAAP
jgi:hypothetical protein